MGLPIQRPVQGLDKSNLVSFTEQAKLSPTSRTLLQGWKGIATELERSVRTVQRWERNLNLPVHKLGKGRVCPVFAFKDELHLWLRSNGAYAPNGNAARSRSGFQEDAVSDRRKSPQRVALTRQKQSRQAPAITSEPEIIQSLNAFFALESRRHDSGSCGSCHSPVQFLVGHFWLYGTEKTWQVSVPFCPGCDSDIRALLPSSPQSVS